MLEVRVKFPREQFVKALRALDPRTVAWAEAQALNRTGANVQQAGLKEVSKYMGISETRLAKRGRKTDFRGSSKFGAFNPTKKATPKSARLTLSARGRPFNVRRFGGKAIHAGARTSLKQRKTKGKGRILAVQHQAWGRDQVALGVWQLRNGAFVVKKGETFRGVFGPGVTNVIQRRPIMTKLEQVAATRFTHHFNKAIEFAFSRAGQAVVR